MHPNRGGKWGTVSHGKHEPPWEGPRAPDGEWSQITSSPTLTSLYRPCVSSNYSGTIRVESQLSKFFVSMTIAPTSLLKTPNQFFLYSILPFTSHAPQGFRDARPSFHSLPPAQGLERQEPHTGLPLPLPSSMHGTSRAHQATPPPRRHSWLLLMRPPGTLLSGDPHTPTCSLSTWLCHVFALCAEALVGIDTYRPYHAAKMLEKCFH